VAYDSRTVRRLIEEENSLAMQGKVCTSTTAELTALQGQDQGQ